MRFFGIGLFIGIALAISPFASLQSGFIFIPEWCGNIESFERIEPSPSVELSEVLPPLKTNSAIHLLRASGTLLESFTVGDKLAAPSYSGEYVALYEQVGKHIEFFNIKGERFWKLSSLEYPILTANAKLILLINGDQSAIRLIDFNGNPAGCKYIAGRFCTSVFVHRKTDVSAAGFFDGSFYLFNDKGEITYYGVVAHAMIKSLAASSRGSYLAVHYGWNNRDAIRIVDATTKTHRDINLKASHHTRIPLHIDENGDCALIEQNRFIIFNRNLTPKFSIELPSGKDGHATIDYANGIYLIAYTLAKGGSFFAIIRERGEIIFNKIFETEDYLDCFIGNKFILVKGRKNLYCYSYLDPAIQ
ncbi:MAG: hypothetical protein N2316_00515 [Spirochaetes bacterium]|nr:hypothetical protein [Spirochaetota bacterium]